MGSGNARPEPQRLQPQVRPLPDREPGRTKDEEEEREEEEEEGDDKEEDEEKIKEEQFNLEDVADGLKNKDERVKCEVCEIDVLKSYLRRHMKRKHGNKEENPDVQDFGEE